MSWEPEPGSIRGVVRAVVVSIALIVYGAILCLNPRYSILGVIFIFIGIVLMATSKFFFYEPALQETTSTETTHRKQTEITAKKQPVAKRKCEYCGEDIFVANARFCWSCGASLPAGAEDEALIRAVREEAIQPADRGSHKREKECMICNLALKPTDLTVWCPHCGNAFHRDHMLEWLHMKHSCPTCGKHLDEPAITDKASKHNRRRNR